MIRTGSISQGPAGKGRGKELANDHQSITKGGGLSISIDVNDAAVDIFLEAVANFSGVACRRKREFCRHRRFLKFDNELVWLFDIDFEPVLVIKGVVAVAPDLPFDLEHIGLEIQLRVLLHMSDLRSLVFNKPSPEPHST